MKKLIEKCTTETSRRALKADLRRLEDRREAMNRKREEQTARQRAARPTAPGDKKKSARFESDVAHGYSRWIANRKERGRQRMEARRRSRTGQYAKEKVEEERNGMNSTIKKTLFRKMNLRSTTRIKLSTR